MLFDYQTVFEVAFLAIRLVPGALALGFGVEADGDLDLLVSETDARRTAEGVLVSFGSAQLPLMWLIAAESLVGRSVLVVLAAQIADTPWSVRALCCQNER